MCRILGIFSKIRENHTVNHTFIGEGIKFLWDISVATAVVSVGGYEGSLKVV